MDFVSNAELYALVAGRTGTTRYFTLASVIWLGYDWLLTLGDEIELIWSRDWTLAGKPMYLFVRYGGMLFQIYDLVQMMGMWSAKLCVHSTTRFHTSGSEQFFNFSCTIYSWLLPIGTVTLLYTMDLLLAYRALCLYRMNRKILWINVVAYLLCLGATVSVFGLSVPQYITIDTPEYLTGCWSVTPSYDFVGLIPGLLYELWLFGLVVAKVITYVRTNGWHHMQGVFRILVKDSSIWFFIVTGGIIWNLLGLAIAPRGLKGIAIPIFRNIIIICGCRLVLHLRKAYFVQADEGVSHGRSSTAFNAKSHTFGGTPRKHEDTEEERARKAIDFAQKIGLPPVVKNELGSWDEDDVIQAANGGRDVAVVSSPGSHRSGARSKNKKRRSRRRDLEAGLDEDVTPTPFTMTEPQECFEMVRVRVDVESHAVVEEVSGVGALTPRERRVRLAAGGGGESSRVEMMRAMGQDEEDDSTEYESSSSSSVDRKR